MKLESQIDSINEFRDVLGESSISRLSLDDEAIKFSLQGGRLARREDFSLHTHLGSPALVVCTSDAALALADFNKKLADGCSLGKALSLLGRALKVDLDWVREADQQGGASASEGGCSDEDMAEGDDDEAGSLSGSDDFDTDVLREWSRRLVRLEAVEAAAEAAAEDQASTSRTDHVERQIFDQRAAFRRLVNELEEIFKEQDYNLVAEAPGPLGLSQWEVSLAGFPAGSQLAADLHQAGRKHGLSAVQLQINFKRGLHPFYPPSVVVTSPRFKGPVMAAVACHPMFKLESWEFTQSAKDIILKIKDFLQSHARVDLESPHPGYLPAEHLLVRLQALTGVPPADASITPEVAYADAFQDYISKANAPEAVRSPGSAGPASKKARAGPPSGGSGAEGAAAGSGGAFPWGAGVGYGHGKLSGKAWDARRAEEVQAARDAESCEVLNALAEEMAKRLAEPSAGNTADRELILTALRSGCLVPLLTRELSAVGFHGMVARVPYYGALLRCVAALTRADTADMLAWHAQGEVRTLAGATAALRAQAATFLQVCGVKRFETDEEEDYDLAQSVIKVADEVAAVAPPAAAATATAGPAAAAPAGRMTRRQAAAAAVAGTSSAVAVRGGHEAEEARYVSTLSSFRVRVIPGVATNHAYRDAASREATAPSRVRARRVASELAAMESDLPVTTSSSVFVVADEQQTILWKAMITGPADTPYEGGCFLFDVYFPSEYPDRAPQVKLRTTAGGTVRFNPNLYADGKVCLSLLGTWSGDRGESWNAEYSSMLQVLVSIQSLILVENPYYNEPGHESRPNDTAAHTYSANIMEQTLRWAMLDQLRSPPETFAEVIRAHFRERGDAVLVTVRRWEAWCREKGQSGRAANIKKMIPELEVEISKLRAGGVH